LALWVKEQSPLKALNSTKIVQQPVPMLLSYRFPFQQGIANSGSIPKFTLIIAHRIWQRLARPRHLPAFSGVFLADNSARVPQSTGEDLRLRSFKN
jgi:hypothetical protein